MSIVPPPPTPTERALIAGMYLFTGGIGLSVLLWPPANAVMNQLSFILSIVWALFILTAFLAIPVMLAGKYLVEYALLPFFWTALAVASAAVWLRTGQDPYLTARVCTGTALLFGLSIRFYALNKLIRVNRAAPRRGFPWTRK